MPDRNTTLCRQKQPASRNGGRNPAGSTLNVFTQVIADSQSDLSNCPTCFSDSHLSLNVPPTAMDVACLRPSAEARSNKELAPNSSFSDGQSLKLYALLTKLRGVGGYSHTFGALDPVQAVQMAPHLSSVYVSGWQCSSTASTTNEPGPGE